MAEINTEVRTREGIPVIELSGYLSSESAIPVEEGFAQIGEANKVILVFHEKAFINSAGLAVLFDLIFPLKEKGKEFRIVHPSKHFRKVFDIVGLSKDVEIFESEEQAIKGW